MPKVKNWDRQRANEVGKIKKIWVNREGRNPVKVDVSKFGPEYIVSVQEMQRGGPRSLKKMNFDKLDDAEDAAMKYIKNNPNPIPKRR